MYYYYNFGQPSSGLFSNIGLAVGWIVMAIAAIVGLVLFFTFLRRKNENKFHGGTRKVYNFFNFNRFYTEDIIRLLYIMCAFALTAGGVVYIIRGSIILGIALIIGGNLALRLLSELMVVFMVMVRRLVSVDKKLSKIEKFYEDDYSDWDAKATVESEEDFDDDFECTGHCDGCGASCTPDFKEEHEIKEAPGVIYAGHVEKEKLGAPEGEEEYVTPEGEKEVTEE